MDQKTQTPGGLGDPQPGPSRGFRSIEINFSSEVDANQIIVVEAALANDQCQWIGGEVAGPGLPIIDGMPWTWGVCVGLPPFAAGASMSFAQMGQPRGGLTFSNGPDGTSICSFAPAGGLSATVTQQTTGDPNHSVFKVVLTGRPG